jgi:ribonuclease-3
MEDKVVQIHRLIESGLKDQIFVQAFTHSSSKGINFTIPVNDRMELVGDKILDLILYNWLYKNTDYDKGKMDKIRQEKLSDKSLSKTFDIFQLDKYVRKNPGQPLNETIKANVIESLFYAAYLKGGLKLALEFWSLMILPLF